MENLKVNVNANGNDVTIRNGEALKLLSPLVFIIVGVLASVLEFVQNNLSKVTENSAVIIDRDKMDITFREDYKDPYGLTVTGKLQASPEIGKFSINTGTEYEPEHLARLFRMNKAFFSDQTEAAKLITHLNNFKAKIDRDIEKANDNRGNITMLKRQAVQSNLPDKFSLNLRVFKGLDPETIEVEVDINPDNLTCSLISPQIEELKYQLASKLIDEQVKALRDILKDKEVPFIEV